MAQTDLRAKKAGRGRKAAAALALPVVLSLTLGGCIGYDGSLYRGYVLDPRAIDQVKVGSSAEQVLVVLGTPTTTSTVGGSAWYYISQKAVRRAAFMKPKITDQRVLAVYFDKNKKVTRIANYGLQDGRVFDYNSRTTRTAGKEPSFLRNMLTGLMRF